MNFSVNHPILYVLAAVIISIVLAQSVFFLILAWRRGVKMGMDKKKLRRIVINAAIFTIAPAIAIIISVATLAKNLGIPLPWLRLSVVGSQSYETIAAANTMEGMGLSLGSNVALNASQYVTIATVMTISIMVGIWLVPVVAKKMQKGMISMEKRDKKWADIFSASMFIGMIAAFLGYVFCDVSRLWMADANGMVYVMENVDIGGETIKQAVPYSATSGLIPVCVMAVSAIVMVICGLAMKKFKWLGEYALPISLVAGMAAAIPITGWLS